MGNTEQENFTTIFTTIDDGNSLLRFNLTEAIFNDPTAAPALGELLQIFNQPDSGATSCLTNVEVETLQRLAGKLEKLTRIGLSRIEEEERAKQEFLDKFGITTGPDIVKVTIPRSYSRLQALKEIVGKAEQLAEDNYSISLALMEALRNEKRFGIQVSRRSSFIVNGSVGYVQPDLDGSHQQYIDHITSHGESTAPKISDLALAHAAYFVASGKDLFGQLTAQAKNGFLKFVDGVLVLDQLESVGRQKASGDSKGQLNLTATSFSTCSADSSLIAPLDSSDFKISPLIIYQSNQDLFFCRV